MYLADTGMVGELPDGTQSQKDFSLSKNNRFVIFLNNFQSVYSKIFECMIGKSTILPSLFLLFTYINTFNI